MKIKMVSLAASPSGVLLPGEVYDLPEAEAQAFLAARAAVAAPEKVLPPIERDAPQRATARRGKAADAVPAHKDAG